MTERLIIRNFAGLDNIDIELGRINIFIGPQASGKSVCAKCIYLFKSFLPDFLTSASLGNSWQVFENAFISRFKEYFPDIWRSDEFLFLRYEVNGRFIEITKSSDDIALQYDQLFRRATYDLIGGLESIHKKYPEDKNTWRKNIHSFNLLLEEKKLIDKITESLYEKVGYMTDTSQLFIPAGRSFFTTIKGATLSFLANTPVIDPLLKDFLSQYELGRKYQPNKKNFRIKQLWSLVETILKGELVTEGEENFIVKGDRKVRIANASSGQQESFALLLLLMNLVSDNNEIPNQGPHTVYVEEPEAHLFPNSQRAITQLMATVYHESVYRVQYIITTHSPYLLSSFNNFIYAYHIADSLHNKPDKLNELYTIVPKNQQISLSDFKAFGLEEGQAKDLIDYETGLLSADLLDSASDVTAEQFSELMALDPAISA